MRYSSDLTDTQWEFIKEHFDVGNYGNRRKHPTKELVSAILFLTKTGCQWRSLPKTFPPWQAVYNRRHKESVA